jgi:hypothetical protein
MTDEYWLGATMELLRRCDTVLMLSGWSTSSGSKAEKEEALRLGLPILRLPTWESLIGRTDDPPELLFGR